ncbi:hypothetical protein ACLOJK_001536 [Asimina triloba]
MIKGKTSYFSGTEIPNRYLFMMGRLGLYLWGNARLHGVSSGTKDEDVSAIVGERGRSGPSTRPTRQRPLCFSPHMGVLDSWDEERLTCSVSFLVSLPQAFVNVLLGFDRVHIDWYQRLVQIQSIMSGEVDHLLREQDGRSPLKPISLSKLMIYFAAHDILDRNRSLIPVGVTRNRISKESISNWQEKIDINQGRSHERSLENRSIRQQSAQDGDLNRVDGRVDFFVFSCGDLSSWLVRDPVVTLDDIKIPSVSYCWDGGDNFCKKAVKAFDNGSTKWEHGLMERSLALERCNVY